MNYLTLSIKNVQEDCIKLGMKIEKDNFKADCIIYIKSGGYLIGKFIGDYFKIPVKGFRISRQGNVAKTKLSFLIKIIPKFVKNILRELEVKSGIHNKKKKRIITEIDNNLLDGKNVLLVDDSVDTGNTIITAINFLNDNYKNNLNIKIVSLNKFKMSEKIINTDYYLYEDSIIIYPWSKDSNEYKEFINCYKQENL